MTGAAINVLVEGHVAWHREDWPLGNPVDELVARYTSKFTVTRIRSSADKLARILSSGACVGRCLDWPAVGQGDALRLRAEVARSGCHSGAVGHLSTIRMLMRQCWRLGYVSAEQYMSASDLPPIKGQRLKVGRQLTPDELRAMFAAATRIGKTPAMCARNQAMLAVLLATGCRAGELLRLDFDHLTFGADRVTLRVPG